MGSINYKTSKQDCLKELTKIKKFLLKEVEEGLNVIYPGWCTGEESYEESLKTVKKAIALEKKTI